ncbi:hypothetical protein X801_05408, partial [Opisthorchis viverrini]
MWRDVEEMGIPHLWHNHLGTPRTSLVKMDFRTQASPASPRELSAWTSDEDLAAQRLRSPYKLSPVDRPSSTFDVGQSTTGRYTFADFYHAASCVKFNKKHYLIPTAVSLRTSRCEPGDQTQPSCRVYFVCYPRSEDVTRFIPTLFCCDVSLSSPTDVELPWFHLLPDDFTMDNAPISLAESLLRERMRATSSGVADFEVESSGHLVITASSRIFFANDTAEINQSAEVVKPIEAPVMAPLQPKLCPTNPDLIACVAFGQLTIGHCPSNTWVPQTYFETDSCANAISDLRVCQFDLSAEGETQLLAFSYTVIHSKTSKNGGREHLGDDLLSSDGLAAPVWCQMLTRLQDSLQIFLIPTSNFHETHLRDNQSDDDETMEPFHRVSLPCIRLLREEDVQFWVQYIEGMEVEMQASEALKVDLKATTRKMVASEANKTTVCKCISVFMGSYAVSYASGTRGKLTRLTPLKPDAQFGDVQPSPGYGAPTDEESCYDPYFPVSGTTSYPLSFKLSAFDPASGWAVVSSSSLNRTTGVQVVKIHHTLTESSACGKNLAMIHVAWLRHHIPHEQVLPNQLRPCDPPRVVRFDIEHQPNPSGTIDESAGFSDSPIARPPQQSSTYLYGLLFTPKQPKPAGGYPTVHFVYGGPGVQLVLGTYAKVTLMHALVYCHFGYAVFLCDCRGSSNRGIQFAGHIKNQLGLPELDDHVAFLKHVAQKTGLIDLSRVAITGNSY